MSALDLPLREQAARIAAGDLDAGELLDACLARIDERNPDLNAIVANVADIRFVPIDMRGAGRLILATCLPFMAVALAIMPFAEILKFAASVLL